MNQYLKNNYVRAVLAKARNIRHGVHIVDIYHDNWCAIWKGGTCNCKPEINIRKVRD
jgi:hypothetical protein